MPAAIDLTGRNYGRLIVLGLSHRGKRGRAWWNCKCECGNESCHQGANLRSGATTSCGCFRKEKAAAQLIGARSITHGLSGTRLHNVWAGMIARCINPKNNSYRYYGAKGIRVCDEWRDFSTFNKWALENGCRDGLSIDRLDPKGNYAPENCQWITLSENARRMQRSRKAA